MNEYKHESHEAIKPEVNFLTTDIYIVTRLFNIVFWNAFWNRPPEGV
jgi:hypothetical protein